MASALCEVDFLPVRVEQVNKLAAVNGLVGMRVGLPDGVGAAVTLASSHRGDPGDARVQPHHGFCCPCLVRTTCIAFGVPICSVHW
jgi:hypothetical protein